MNRKPKKRELLRRLDELYKIKANPKRGRPDFSSTDPIDDEIKQAKYQIDQLSLYQSNTRSWIAIAVSIIGVSIAAVAFVISLL